MLLIIGLAIDALIIYLFTLFMSIGSRNDKVYPQPGLSAEVNRLLEPDEADWDMNSYS